MNSSEKSQQGQAVHAERLNSYLLRCDLSVVSIIDFGFGKVSFDEYTRQEQVRGCLFVDYQDYSRFSGQILWSNGKPCVSARMNMWKTGQAEDTSSEIAKNIVSITRL